MTIEELLRDEALVSQLEEAGSIEAVEKLLADRGLKMSAEELRDAMEAIGSGEMSEDSLDAVAGGIGRVHLNDPINNPKKTAEAIRKLLKKLFGW